MKDNYNDILEQQLFQFAQNDKAVPEFVDKAIETAINRSIKHDSNKIFYKIKKIIIFIVSLGIATTSVVFAKDIVKFFKAIFTNSTSGIDSAVENGKAYNIDMDFVYSNDVGIKVNSIVEDDNIIDIAFVFDFLKEKGITNITLSEFEVLEGNEVIADYNYEKKIRYIDDNKNSSSKAITFMNDFRLIDNLYYKSILLNTEEKIDIKNLKLNISQIQIYKDGEIKTIDGNWNFNIKLNENENNLDELIYEESNLFNVNYNDDIIKEISYEINDTNFIINIEFLEEFNLDVISDLESILIKNELNNRIDIDSIGFLENNSNVSIEIALGKYNLPEKLNLYIKYNTNQDTIIEFYK